MVVVKLGGSLLTLAGVSARISTLLQSRPEMRPVFVVGGGLAADAVRTWGREQEFGEEACHRLALAAMTVTAKLLSELVPRSRVITDRSAAERCWAENRVPILCMEDWLASSEAQAESLPHTWDVTSDSLAAWLAIRWEADELWLLKSTDLPPEITALEASRRELVDRFFPHLAPRVRRIRWCNLRDASPRLQMWK